MLGKMFLFNTFTYLLVLTFIVASYAAPITNNPQTYNFQNVASRKTRSAHSVTADASHETRSIEPCLICHVVGHVRSDTNSHKYHDHDSNSVSTFLSYNKGQSQDEYVNDYEPNHENGYGESTPEGMDIDEEMTLMQTCIEQIQDNKRQEQEQEDEQPPHATINRTNEEKMNSDSDDADDDENYLIGCGNNQTLTKCTALYHKNCLTKWFEKSNKAICLICHRNISQTLLPQHTKQTSRILTAEERHMFWRQYYRSLRRRQNVMRSKRKPYMLICCLALVMLVMMGVVGFGLYLIIALIMSS